MSTIRGTDTTKGKVKHSEHLSTAGPGWRGDPAAIVAGDVITSWQNPPDWQADALCVSDQGNLTFTIIENRHGCRGLLAGIHHPKGWLLQRVERPSIDYDRRSRSP